MSTYRIDFKNAAGKRGTVTADAGFNYTDKLNKVNDAYVNISSMSTVDRTLIAVGSEVYIYRNDVLEFHGVVDDRSVFVGGGVSLHAMGYEKWLTIEHGAYAGSPYTATASATIISAVIAESTKWTAGTITAGTNLDYRMVATDSLWNVISDIRTKTQQDITLNYTTSVIGISAHKGSATSVKTFNSEIDIHNIRYNNAFPKGNKVIVWGQGEGVTRIKSAYPAHGYSASSQVTYGVIPWDERDTKVLTVDEANILADALVAIYKQPIKVYDFEISDFSVDIESGDVIILNSPSQDLNAEQVRITGITRGMKGRDEYWTLEVANEEYSRSLKTQAEINAAIDKRFQDQQTYNQYQCEYSNKNCNTCVGGFACFCTNGGLLDICGMNRITGPSGYLDFSNVGCDIVLVPTSTVIITKDLSMNDGPGRVRNMLDPVCNQDAATKYYVDNCGGGGTLWADGTNPYIVPCNSCSICVPGIAMTGNISDADSTHCMGTPSSPGAFAQANAACGNFTTQVTTPKVCGANDLDVYACGTNVASFGCVCTCLGTVRTKNINAFSNGGCCVGLTACRFGEGYINCFFACRKMVLPVGTNCY